MVVAAITAPATSIAETKTLKTIENIFVFLFCILDLIYILLVIYYASINDKEIFFNLTFVSLDSFKNPKTSSTFVIFYFHYITNQKKQTISVNCG